MTKQFNRRKFLVYSSTSFGASLLLKSCVKNYLTPSSLNTFKTSNTIKVGILHSLSGTMAISEKSVVDAEKLAIKEINATGGVLGKQIEAIVEDGASNWDTFKEKAIELIDLDKVAAIFGCWTSASCKNVKSVFESKDHMLWYPVQYEGQECPRNIFYTGATPNQQIEPSVHWLLKNKGKEFFLIGSDYIFPRTASKIIKSQLEVLGGKIVYATTTPVEPIPWNQFMKETQTFSCDWSDPAKGGKFKKV